MILKQKRPARGYSIDVPAPDVLNQQEYERHLNEARRRDTLQILIKTAGSFFEKLFSKDRKTSKSIAQINDTKQLDIIY
jgi:hypothetical protein